MKKPIKQMGGSSSIRRVRAIDEKLITIYRRLPYTYYGMYRKVFDIDNSGKNITILDLGCGDGSATQYLNLPKNYEISGVDLYKPYLKIAKKLGIYKKLTNIDVRKVDVGEKYNIVVASHVLEHMTKKDGKKFINKIETIAINRVIIAAPIGELPQDEYDGNIYQIHKSQWSVKDMKDLGYEVKVQGYKSLWGNENVVEKYGILSYILFFISYLFTPLLQLYPEKGTYMLCYKDNNHAK